MMRPLNAALMKSKEPGAETSTQETTSGLASECVQRIDAGQGGRIDRCEDFEVDDDTQQDSFQDHSTT